MSSVLVAFGAGFGAGVVIGMLIGAIVYTGGRQ
jgi:hypothetical protein